LCFPRSFFQAYAAGAHCVRLEGKKKFNCLYIADMGDGKYEKRKKNGKAIIFFKMVKGKMAGL